MATPRAARGPDGRLYDLRLGGAPTPSASLRGDRRRHRPRRCGAPPPPSAPRRSSRTATRKASSMPQRGPPTLACEDDVQAHLADASPDRGMLERLPRQVPERMRRFRPSVRTWGKAVPGGDPPAARARRSPSRGGTGDGGPVPVGVGLRVQRSRRARPRWPWGSRRPERGGAGGGRYPAVSPVSGRSPSCPSVRLRPPGAGHPGCRRGRRPRGRSSPSARPTPGPGNPRRCPTGLGRTR